VRVWVVVLCVGCTSRALPGPGPAALGTIDLSSQPPHDLAAHDLSTPDLLDLSAPDLSAPDLSAPDLSAPDLAAPPDLSTAPDLGAGRRWVEVPVPNDAYVEDISGWSDAVLLALSGSVSSFDGTTWTTLLDATSDPIYAGGFNSVYAVSSTEYYATIPAYARVSDQSLVFASDGASWTKVFVTPANNIRLFRLLSGEMVIVGQGEPTPPALGAVVYIQQSSTWNLFDEPNASDFAGFWGTSPSDFYASGWPSYLDHYTGSSYQKISGGPLDRFFFTWGKGTNDVYTGGEGIFHYDGTSFTQVVPGGIEMYDVWGAAADRAYAVGCTVVSGNCVGALLYYFDGTSWSTQPAPPGKQPVQIWGRSDSDLWIAVDGKLFHSE